jgi:hypothetical protein
VQCLCADVWGMTSFVPNLANIGEDRSGAG